LTDPLFDQGHKLPRTDAAGLFALAKTSSQIANLAFTPAGSFEPLPPARYAVFRNIEFANVKFREVTFKRITFRNCRFDNCLLISAKFEDCEFHSCTFNNCNTIKFSLVRTYLDPKSFVDGMVDKRKYSNIGVDLFQTLLHNSAAETQPTFRRTAEYNFKLWERYNHVYAWKSSAGFGRWANARFYFSWIGSVISQRVLGFGLHVGNIVLSTLFLFGAWYIFNCYCWERYAFIEEKMKPLASASHASQAFFFTMGNLSTFGTGEISPASSFGMIAVAVQVAMGITWIAIATAIIVKRLIR
jgi:hypothetical protein